MDKKIQCSEAKNGLEKKLKKMLAVSNANIQISMKNVRSMKNVPLNIRLTSQ